MSGLCRGFYFPGTPVNLFTKHSYCVIKEFMRTNKFFVTLFSTCIISAAAFAQSVYIKIVDPYPSGGEVERYAYETDIAAVKYTFTGNVSSGCKSIRVLWTDNDSNTIDEYLYGGSKAVRGATVDDFYLKKYKPGDSTFVYNVSGAYENLSFGSNYYRFIAEFSDGTVKITNLTFYLHSGGAAERAKPVIYLYPTKKQNIKVNVKPEGPFTVTIPEIGKGWNVTATPDGRIYDRKTKQEYPYLFWESADSGEPADMSEGFVVEGSEVASFFREKLSYIGLNEKEINDFLEFWEPKLSGSPYAFITFYSSERINSEAPLTVSPKPDSVIRVYFDYVLLDEAIEVREQTLEKGERKGFTVTEWGGRLHK